MNDTTSRPPIIEAIEAAYEKAHRLACGASAAWVQQTGWRLEDEHFEDELARFRPLTADDQAELRARREQLIEEHAGS